jgi:diamine N-acetyltransferase
MLKFTAATPLDIPTLQDLAHRIWHAYYPGIITVEQIDYMLARFFRADILQAELAADRIWELARLDDQPVGFLGCAAEPEQRRLKLSKLYLLPALHGQGLGQEMLARVKALAEHRRADEIHLTVNKRNSRAIRAYLRAGFELVESVKVEIGDGFVMDDYVMRFREKSAFPASSSVSDLPR